MLKNRDHSTPEAATACGRFKCGVLNVSWVPGRRIYPNANTATILRRRHPPGLQRGMQRPSDGVVVHAFHPPAVRSHEIS